MWVCEEIKVALRRVEIICHRASGISFELSLKVCVKCSKYFDAMSVLLNLNRNDPLQTYVGNF